MACPPTLEDQETLKRTKEGVGHAKQRDNADAWRQERDIGNTTSKRRIKGNGRKTEWRKSKVRRRWKKKERRKERTARSVGGGKGRL
jgi:hypothetical protein